MAAPTLTHLGAKQLAVANTNSSLMDLIITKEYSFYSNGSNESYRINHNTPLTTTSTGSKLSGEFGQGLWHSYGHQYDPIADTLILCINGNVSEYKPDGTKVKGASWSSVLGASNYQGVVLGYQGESYFYIIASNKLYRCPRNLEGSPVFVMNFAPNTNYTSSWTPNGFFNGVYVYMLYNSGGYKVRRTNVTNGDVTDLALTGVLSGGNPTWLTLSYHEERVVTIFANYSDNTYPAVSVYDVAHIIGVMLLIKDGTDIKSYSDTGYTRNVCINGAVISSMGYEPGHPNTDAFDDNMSTFWGSNETGLGVPNAFIGYDFELTPRHIRRIELTKADNVANTPTEILVQYSDDGAVWTDATLPITMTMDTGMQVIDLPTTVKARRWRLKANATLATGVPWRIRDIKMYERNLTGWYVVGPAPATEEMFLINGLTDTAFITNENLTYLDNDEFDFEVYLAQGNTSKLELDFDAVPHPRIVYPKGDIPLASVEQINSFTLSATEINKGVVRIIVSVDEGLTWKTWDIIHDKWINIDNTDLASVKLNGMTIATLNERVAAEWSMLILDKVRFAYYIEQETLDDKASTEILRMDVDMHGAWEKAKDSDYTYSYPNNTVVTIRLFTDGDYKINFDTNTGASSGSGGVVGVLDGGTF